MEEILKDIQWNELYPETISRLTVFRDMFRKHYSVEQISDGALDKSVCYNFGIYGQGMVYEIFSVATISDDGKRDLDLSAPFAAFEKAFTDALGEEVTKDFTPNIYIKLFIEYLYSLVIKTERLH